MKEEREHTKRLLRQIKRDRAFKGNDNKLLSQALDLQNELPVYLREGEEDAEPRD